MLLLDRGDLEILWEQRMTSEEQKQQEEFPEMGDECVQLDGKGRGLQFNVKVRDMDREQPMTSPGEF